MNGEEYIGGKSLRAKGRLLLIGGAEDKEGDCLILKEFVRLAGGAGARVAVLAVAPADQEAVGDAYREVFLRLGAGEAEVLLLPDREAARQGCLVEAVNRATGLFFPGGDQLRVTSRLGGTPVEDAVRHAYHRGVVVGGTSAGAAVMTDTMIVAGDSADAPQKCATNLAPGLGLLEETVLDQHFAQRGRLGRLLSALAQNPHILGIGVDEDTALRVDPDGRFWVLGSRTVTVVDGRGISHANASEVHREDPLALTDVRLHVLPTGYGFDLGARRPLLPAGCR